MKNNYNAFDAQEDPIITVLIDTVRNNHPKTCVINPKRWCELLLAKEALNDLLKQNGDGSAEITYFPEFLSASISAEVESLEVQDFTAFQIAMVKANNFEIYPLVNGKLRIAFMFSRLMLPVE